MTRTGWLSFVRIGILICYWIRVDLIRSSDEVIKLLSRILLVSTFQLSM